MHLYLVVGLTVVLLGMVFISWVRRAPPATVQPVLNTLGLVVGGALLLFLAARTHWSVLGLAAIPILQRLMLAVRSAKAAKGPTPGQVSEVQTDFLQMSIDHDSGQMSGRVLKGAFSGREIESLDIDELRELLQECEADPQSVSVLEAYVERMFGSDTGAHHDGDRPSRPASGSHMTREDALSILDLEPGASHDEIIAAHRRLMQRVHPDRGGSSYLAAQINRAKDVLLGG